MDDDLTPEIPEAKQSTSKPWFSRLIGPALLSVTGMLNPAGAAPPAKPIAKQTPKTVVISTNVKASNKQDMLPGQKSLTHGVSDHFYKAEQCRKKKDKAGFEKHFYAGMGTLMDVIEKPVPEAYDDVNNVRTIGIGFNMDMPFKKGKDKDGLSRKKWSQFFGSNAPNFDDCKNGNRSLSHPEMERLFEGMLKDSEAYLRKKFNKAAEELKHKNPNKEFRYYDDLPANQRGALLSIHYQSPRIAVRLYDELASGDLKAASKELLRNTLARKYASRRDVEHALLTTETKSVPVSQLAANIKQQIRDAKWDQKTVMHAYGTPKAQHTEVKEQLKENKSKKYVVSTHGKDGRVSTSTNGKTVNTAEAVPATPDAVTPTQNTPRSVTLKVKPQRTV